MNWWVVFEDDNGVPCLRGPFDEDEAQRKLDSLDRDGKIYELRTSNSEVATRLIKEKRINELGFDKGSKNVRHKNLSKYEVYDG